MPSSPAPIKVVYAFSICVILLSCTNQWHVFAFHRAPCTETSIRRQFQFSDCYAPNLNPNIPLNQASFVMSHDSATGYLSKNQGKNMNDEEYQREMQKLGYNQNGNNNGRWNRITTALLSLYGKTQVGSVYDQLNNGARALDLRPKIYNNGTVGFHHGSLIDIPLTSITLRGLLEDAKQWCKDNPKELVLIFHSELVHEAGYNGLSSQLYIEVDDDDDYGDGDNDDGVAEEYHANADDGDDDTVIIDDAFYAYEYKDDQQEQEQQNYEYIYSGIATLKNVYDEKGVPYYSCEKLGGLNVSQAMELADLSKYGGKGYLLAVDRHDIYASFCGKANWAQDQLVTCYSSTSNYNNDEHDGPDQNNANIPSYVQCTDRKNSGVAKLNDLKTYVTASANNDPSDSPYELGPPEDESYYPFNQIQGLWQVDATSVQIGLLHASTLLDDNRISKVNEEMVKMAYEGQFNTINIFAIDNVALNGNAMFSVLRNQCGQSVLKDNSDEPTCGRDLIMPKMETNRTLPIFWNIVLVVVYGSLVIMVTVMLFQAFRLRNKGPQDHRLVCHGHII
mmetsp:Transcript_10554/g.21739  ORF Transcript_10554/g.21739 Transcript_10554/m.21739 type:complete len:562 (-) Transcript_10554:183-1868(-)